MKRILIGMAFNLIATFSQAQHNLEFGQNELFTVIKQPYVHYDALRLQQSGWIREVKNNNNQWMFEKKVVSVLAEPDLFSLVADSTYSTEKARWELKNHFQYSYLKNNNTQLSSRIERSWQETPSGKLNKHGAFKYSYNDNGKVDKIVYQQYDSTTQNFITEYTTFISYNDLGLRVKDSIALELINNYYVVDYYEYNNFGECKTKISTVFNNGKKDTNMVERMVYDNGNISRYDLYIKYGDELKFTEVRRFSYDDNGLVTYAGVFIPETPTVLNLNAAYYLDYTDLGKLKYIASYARNQDINKVIPSDSVAFAYLSNGDITTSYGYIVNTTTNTINNTPTYRFTFSDEIANSLKEVKTAQTTFTVYPNPVNHTLHIDAIRDEIKVKKVVIINLQGQITKTVDGTEMIYVEDLPTGMYLLRLETENQVFQTKFMKE